MDAPPIQYCRTTDDVNIAYWTMGDGPTVLVMLTPSLSHVRLEWEVPRFRRFYQALARDLQVVRYNPRGSGLSDTYAPTLGTLTRLDISAVLQAVQAQDASLVVCGNGAMLASYPVAHLGRSVSSFVALSPGAKPAAMAMVGQTMARLTPENEAVMTARVLDPDGLPPPPDRS